MKSFIAGSKLLLACLVGIVVTAALSGCGPRNYAIRSEQITPEHIEIAHHHQGTVQLKVEGGWDTPFLGLQLMPNEAVMDGLRKALQDSNLFERISTDDQGDYKLAVFIFDIDQPLLGGGDVTVNVEMAYTLSHLDTGETIWRESIDTSHLAKADTAFSLMERVNIAAEGATKDNIKKAIERMSNIELSGKD